MRPEISCLRNWHDQALLSRRLRRSISRPVRLFALNQAQTIFLVPFGSDIVLEGRVTDARTSAPIAGATVYINGRYSAITDLAGNYTLPGNLDIGDSSIAWVAADGYEVFVRYIRGSRSQSFRLQRIERITAGESWPVTVPSG